MRWIRVLLVDWNGLVAAICPGLAWATGELLEFPVSPRVLGLLAAGAWLVYGLDRVLPYSPEDRYAGPGQSGPPRVTLVLAGLFCLGALPGLGSPAREGVAVLGLLSVAYIAPVLPGCRRLKEIPFLKSFLVAAGWVAATVLVPVLDRTGGIAGSGPVPVVLLAAYRLIFLLPNLFLADWPHRNSDRKAGIHTLANRLPAGSFRYLCLAVAGCAAATSFALAAASPLPPWIGLEALTPLAWVACLGRSLPASNRFYRTTIDASLLWPVCLAALFA